MNLGKNIKQNFLFINRWKVWLFSLLSATLILACTGDLDNDGYALVSPSFGVTIIPQNPQILKAGTQTFTATGGVTPYTFYLSNTAVGTMVPATGVFTGVQALGAAPAGTATVTAVDSTGVSGTTTMPTAVANAAVCTVSAAALPTLGTETFTILITDTLDGDHGSAKLTLGAP